MRRRELFEHITSLGEPIYGRREAAQIARMVLDEICGVSRTELLLSPQEEVECERLDEICRDVAAGRPIQYIIGEAEFCDMSIAVREGVLIPRPESEELVRWVVSETKPYARLLDIGTGSGALAIAVSRQIDGAKVEAVDISDEALEVAKENVRRLSPSVRIVKGDALGGDKIAVDKVAGVEQVVSGTFDVILSNPPYIPQSESQQMRINVTNYEPHIALFVSDDDPLIFYRSIARSAQKLLSEGGRLYFEIHETLHEQMVEMLHLEGFASVECRCDINDKPRMICAQRG